MFMYQLSPEKIQENFDKFTSLCNKLGDRSPAVQKMLEDIGERMALSPASAKLDYHCAFPGGLVDHSLRVLQNAYKLMQAYDMSFSKESMIISCLFHDLGKIGDEKDDYYVTQKDDWKYKRGEVFAYNNELKYMSVTDRSLWLLQHYGIRLDKDEYLAISLSDGQYVDANRNYGMKEPMLALIVHQADVFSTRWEKENLKWRTK